jgi:uncharacterized protein YqfA (UPF0365 family)
MTNVNLMLLPFVSSVNLNIPVEVVVDVKKMTVKMTTVIIKRQRTVMPRMMIKPIQRYVARAELGLATLEYRLESEYIVIDGFHIRQRAILRARGFVTQAFTRIIDSDEQTKHIARNQA